MKALLFTCIWIAFLAPLTGNNQLVKYYHGPMNWEWQEKSKDTTCTEIPGVLLTIISSSQYMTYAENKNYIRKGTAFRLLVADLEYVPESHLVESYILPFQDLLFYAEKKNYIPKGAAFRLLVGDIQIDPPNGLVAFAKTRPKDSSRLTIANLNRFRHWGTLNDFKDNLSLEEKLPYAIWRGTTTGTNRLPKHEQPRYKLASAWSHLEDPRIDVGYSFICQQGASHSEMYKPHVKDRLSIEEMLQYKYIISVEGNDKDSGLQWKLYSNSVVLMQPPFFESWLREFQLQPYVHYVPLKDDYSDLLEKIEWCESHPELCKNISANATQWVQNFLDKEEEELKLQAKVVKAYYKAMPKEAKLKLLPPYEKKTRFKSIKRERKARFFARKPH